MSKDSNVVQLFGPNVEATLSHAEANKDKYSDIIILTCNKDGEVSLASSYMSHADMAYIMHMGKLITDDTLRG